MSSGGYVLEKQPSVEPGALEVLDRRGMRGVIRSDAALFLDTQLWTLAHADARLSLRLGEALEPMLQRKGYSALGYTHLRDYCLEEVGVSQSTAERSVRLYRGLKKYALARAAFLEGALSESQALLLLSHLPKLGDEAGWVARALELTVRGLQAALESASGQTGEEVVTVPPERAVRHYRLTPAEMLDWQMAREVAGKLAGCDLKDWQLLEFLSAEFLAGPHPVAHDGVLRAPPPPAAPDDRRQRLAKLWQVLEEEFGRWQYLQWAPTPVQLSLELLELLPEDPHARQAQINHLMLCRRRLHLDLGRMLCTLNRMSLWRDMGFASLRHYATERLGLSGTTVHRLVTRERQFLQHPDVYEAVRDGRITICQADSLFPVLNEVPSARDAEWIEFAAGTTCRHLGLVVKACSDLAGTDRETFRLTDYLPPKPGLRPNQIRAMARRSDEPVDLPALLGPLSVVVGWAASWIPTLTIRGRALELSTLPPVHPSLSLRVQVPLEILPLVVEAEAVARAHGAETTSDALRLFLAGFIATWDGADKQTRAFTRRLMESADYRCEVPGCSCRGNLEGHHLVFRSAGGSNKRVNLAVTCWGHHHKHLHEGKMRARRTAEGSILWELGILNGRPYRVFLGEARVRPKVLPCEVDGWGIGAESLPPGGPDQA